MKLRRKNQRGDGCSETIVIVSIVVALFLWVFNGAFLKPARAVRAVMDPIIKAAVSRVYPAQSTETAMTCWQGWQETNGVKLIAVAEWLNSGWALSRADAEAAAAQQLLTEAHSNHNVLLALSENFKGFEKLECDSSDQAIASTDAVTGLVLATFVCSEEFERSVPESIRPRLNLQNLRVVSDIGDFENWLDSLTYQDKALLTQKLVEVIGELKQDMSDYTVKPQAEVEPSPNSHTYYPGQKFDLLVNTKGSIPQIVAYRNLGRSV